MNTIQLSSLGEFELVKVADVVKSIVSKKFIEPTVETYVQTTEGPRKVTKLFINGKVPTRKISFSDDSNLEISLTHRLRDENMNWVYSPDMRVGDKLKTNTGSFLTITDIEESSSFTVDLEVEDLHEYITSNGLINHNTISIIANCSGGVEPLFSLAFIRNVMGGQKLIEVNDIFKNYAIANGFFSEELMTTLAEVGTLHDVDVPDSVKKTFVCAHDITPEWHIRMQAAYQEHCDSSISKTINFPNTATIEDVAKVYEMAFDLECKGVTVYRDGCRDAQPMALAKKTEAPTIEEAKKIFDRAPGIIKEHVKIPRKLPSEMIKITDNEKRNWYVHIDFLDDEKTIPFAMFVESNGLYEKTVVANETISALLGLAKRLGLKEDFVADQESKMSHQSNATKIVRSIGFLLRHNVQVVDIVKVLDEGNYPLASFTFHIKRLLKQYIPDGTSSKEVCPKCGNTLVYKEGCLSCIDGACGWSKCS